MKLKNIKITEIILLVLCFTVFAGSSAKAYLEYQNIDNQKELVMSLLSTSTLDIDSAINQLRELTPDKDFAAESSEIQKLKNEENITALLNYETEIRLQVKNIQKSKKIEEAKRVEEARIAAEKAKAEEEARLAAETARKKVTRAPKAVVTQAPATCSKNELYVIVNVTSNSEQILKGDPDCKTGEVLESRSVATGAHQTFWNPSGWSYWGATPTGKWKIISKEQTSGQFGPWFLRLRHLSGSYVDQYALHGTDDPPSIGNWASHGCIRHYNEDIIHLANILTVGTVVWTVS